MGYLPSGVILNNFPVPHPGNLSFFLKKMNALGLVYGKGSGETPGID